MKYPSEPAVGASTRVGVLLVNLGSPDAPTPAALRRYLAEFLWDPRVVEQPRPLWWLILHGIILRTRPRRSAQAYAAVWTKEGAPLLAISRRQCKALASALEERFGAEVTVELAMRYGSPSVGEGIAALRNRGVDRLLVLPLYPQYSASTTGSVFDALADALKARRLVPGLRVVDSYYEEPGYVSALASSVREHWERHGQCDKLLFSFHGLPRRYADAGDPYPEQCARTAKQVAAALGLEEGRWAMTFQSRFGREEWLMPYTDQTLEEWARQGVSSVQVICPGFAADCLETLEEIAQENAELFRRSGGERFEYIPALNDRADHIAFLADLVTKHLSGWRASGAKVRTERESVAEVQ